MARLRRGAASGARTCVALLAALGAVASSPARSESLEPPGVPGAPASLAGAVAVGRAAVVTLKIPGTARVYGRLAGHGASPDDLFEEPDDAEEPDDEFDTGDYTLGSAVLIEASGIAVTTARLARRVSELHAVTSDGRRLPVTLLGRDDATDVAVLTLCCGAGRFPHVVLANSDRVRVGDRVVAIGAPYGLDGSASASVVAAVTSGDADGLGALIQTGGSVTSGYAGGVLVDTDGAMVGMVVGHGAGAGLALPSNTVRRIASTLLEQGRIRRGWLGIDVQPLDPALASALGARDTRGALVVDVRRGGPAARVGLRPGDIVYEVDGRPVDSAARMLAAIAGFAPGRRITLKAWRRGRDVALGMVVAEAPDARGAGSLGRRAKARLGGLDVGPIASDIGVVVSELAWDGAAARAGIRRGDVIRELNGRATRSLAEFEDALEVLPADARIVMLLQRGATSSYITFSP
jgi:serine protease Do